MNVRHIGRNVLAPLLVISAMVMAHTALAADAVWNGSVDANWNTDGNWDGGVKPYEGMAPTYRVIFGGIGALNRTCVNNMSQIHIGGITFTNSGGYTLVAGAQNHRDVIDIKCYAGSNVIQAGVLANDCHPDVLLATNNSQLIMGNGMAGDSHIQPSVDSTVVINGNITGGNFTFEGQGICVLNGAMTTLNWVYLKSGTIILNADNSISGQVGSQGPVTLIAGGGARSFQSLSTTCGFFGNDSDFIFGGTNNFTFQCKIGRASTHPNIDVTNPAVRVTFLGGAAASNDVQLTKKGPGTLVLGGTSILDSGKKFLVNAGTLLLVNGTNLWANNDTSDAITVASGATLGGMNSEVRLAGQRVVRIQSGGTLNPGDPIANDAGALALGTTGSLGKVVLETGSTLTIDIAQTNADRLAVAGNLDIASGVELRLNQLPMKPVPGFYSIPIIQYSGTRTGVFATTNYNDKFRMEISYGASSNDVITMNLTVTTPGTVLAVR